MITPKFRAEVVGTLRIDAFQGDAFDGSDAHVASARELHGRERVREGERHGAAVAPRKVARAGRKQVFLLRDIRRDRIGKARNPGLRRPRKDDTRAVVGRIGVKTLIICGRGPERTPFGQPRAPRFINPDVIHIIRNQCVAPSARPGESRHAESPVGRKIRNRSGSRNDLLRRRFVRADPGCALRMQVQRHRRTGLRKPAGNDVAGQRRDPGGGVLPEASVHCTAGATSKRTSRPRRTVSGSFEQDHAVRQNPTRTTPRTTPRNSRNRGPIISNLII